jgi:hypothetical protein
MTLAPRPIGDGYPTKIANNWKGNMMSLLTLRGAERLLPAGGTLTQRPDYENLLSAGNGWDSGWPNPGEGTGGSGSGNENDSGSILDRAADAVTDFFAAIGEAVSDFVDSVEGLVDEVGDFFSGDPGTFFDTGVDPNTGQRTDGHELGYGCADAKSDAVVPDHFGNADLIPACRAHDIAYGTPGVSKLEADRAFGAAVRSAVEYAGYSHATAEIVGGLYQGGVELFGQEAYDNAQREAAQP